MRNLWKYLITPSLLISYGMLWAYDAYEQQKAIDQQQTAESAKSEIKSLPTPNDAIKMALADASRIDPFNRQYVRYLYAQNGSTDAMKVLSLALNYISRGSVIQRPYPLANGHLLRIDLRQYAPSDKDLAEWIKIWEDFAFDPTFSTLITKDQSDFAVKAAELFPSQEIIVTPESTRIRKENRTIVHNGGRYVYPDDSGRVHEQLVAGTYTVDLEFDDKIPAVTRREGKAGANADVLRFNGQHLEQEALLQLQGMLVTAAPVIESRYFLTRVLTTIQDKGVFKEVWGGRYYQLRGIKKSTIKGASDLDVFFESLGIGNIKAGLKQETFFNSLRSDQRMAIFRSDITGKSREVSSFHTPADREGGSWGAITGDVKDADVDIGDRAFANLLSPRREAREAIFPTRTGLNIFALFNGDGALQDEVPPDIAVDATIPAPYTRRLQPAIGCLRCHYAEGSDGWKSLTNDVTKLMTGRLDIFGDLNAGKHTFTSETIDRLAGLYAGDFSKNLRRARDDVAEVTLKATGPFKESDTQADIAKIAGVKMSEMYAEYNYTLVNAKTALADMGLDVSEEKSLEVFNQLMAVDVPVNGIFVEDVRIAAIGRGIAVDQHDWALVYSKAAERMQRNLKKLNDK